AISLPREYHRAATAVHGRDGGSGLSGSGMFDVPSIDPRRIEILDPAVVQALRRKSPAKRVAMVFEAQRTMRLMLEAHLKWKHPDWDRQQVAQEIARRWARGTA